MQYIYEKLYFNIKSLFGFYTLLSLHYDMVMQIKIKDLICYHVPNDLADLNIIMIISKQNIEKATHL